MKTKSVLFLVLSTVFLGAFSYASAAQGTPVPYGYFGFTKIADTRTPVPDGVGEFITFSRPAIDGNDVVFKGRDAVTLAYGIYIFNGGTLVKVVDKSTPVPENPSISFTGFDGNVSIENGVIAFEAYFRIADSNQEGVYTATGGMLTKVADTITTTIPGTGKIFSSVDAPSLSYGKVVFQGKDASGFGGIYSDVSGTLEMVVDANSTVPGYTVTFGSFDGDISLDGDSAGFEGKFKVVDANSRGIYIASEGTITKIADSITTMVPGGYSVFAKDLDEPSLDGGHVVFIGEDGLTGQEGIYTNLGGPLSVVADENTTIPGTERTFTDFDDDNCSIEGNNIVFKGYSHGSGGIYAKIDGSLFKVISEGDTLDGKLVSNVRVSFDRALSGDRVAFRAIFVDGSVGIYVAQVCKSCPDLTVDLNRDGSVNLLDFAIFAQQWLKSCP